MINSPKILLFDIETSHNLVAAFKLFEDFTPPENIIQERFVISVAWKWLGSKKIEAVSVLDNTQLFKKDPYNDLHVLKTFHKVLQEADVIVGHNSDKYDIRFLEGRMLIQGLEPLPPINKLDTLKIARKRFLFNSNKLDYLGKVLKVGRKKPTGGNKLWLQVLQGDPKAIKKMVTYNRGDIELLEAVFLKLRPYMPNYVNRELHGLTGCTRCGSGKLQKRGLARNATRTYQRFQCQGCGGWQRSLKAEPAVAKSRAI